jgi:hypothetical protein
MRQAKVWLLGTFIVGLLAGSLLLPITGPTAQGKDEKAVKVKTHWRHHDGHWSYWYEPDNRWYYTDGSNWYYQGDNDDAWRVYSFDKDFGREGFERGEYRVPGEGVKIEVPRFRPYRRR